VVLVATVGLRVRGYPVTGADLATTVAFFSLAARDRPERTFQAAAAVAGTVIALTLLGLVPFETFVLLHLVFGAAWLLGNDLRTRRLRERTLAEQAAQARREQEVLVEHAITNERVRMAQELHDLAAHALGVIAIQAEAGRRALGRRPEQAGSALAAIGGMADEALADLRHLLGFLRGEEALARRPQPTLDDLGALMDSFRTAGLPVTLTVHDELGRPSLTLQTAIYRVVQEALTNTLKHAGYATARVVVRRSAEWLEAEVVDTGRGAAPGAVAGEGLTGMQERVSMLGGELRWGSGPQGGFTVKARLPAADRVSAASGYGEG
jgi:signal transduction histidine kinase